MFVLYFFQSLINSFSAVLNFPNNTPSVISHLTIELQPNNPIINIPSTYRTSLVSQIRRSLTNHPKVLKGRLPFFIYVHRPVSQVLKPLVPA